MDCPPAVLRTIDVFLEGALRPLLVILGPTASGKTSLSIGIARHCGGEIINADSRQMYRHLTIGTAKVTKEEMEGVPHHLLDVFDPREEVTVGVYQEMAQKVIDDVRARGNVPILVGGSMLYVSAITDELSFAPVADKALHDRLMDEYDRDNGAALYKRLQSADPDAAASIHPNNKPRVVRALELIETLRMPVSKSARKDELRPRDAASAASSAEMLILGVHCLRGELKKRITERCHTMLDAGWIDEVRSLLNRGYSENNPALKSTGYREIIQFLRECEQSDADPEFMREALEKKIIAKTNQYAKRQMTWWRNDPRIHWIHL